MMRAALLCNICMSAIEVELPYLPETRDNLFLIVLCRHMALKTKIIWFATEAFFKLVIRNERGQIFH